MKCNKCGEEWTSPVGKSMNYCPFCSESLPMSSLDSENVIKALVLQHGESILLDSKLFSLVADKLQNKTPQMLKRMRLAINDNVPKKMYDLKSSSEQERILKINVIVSALKDDYGMEEIIAIEIVNYFANSLGYKPVTSLKNTTQQNVQPPSSLFNIYENDAEENFHMGEQYKDGKGVNKNPVKAVFYYRKAAEHGYAAVQRELGICYLDGIGIEKDSNKAMFWIKKAVEQGFAPAQRTLGYCYSEGMGTEKDYVKAVKLFVEAIKQGDSEAMNNLGVCYRKGEGVEEDPVQAVYWYKKAIEQGSARASDNLGFCYRNGIGVEKDEVRAFRYYKDSAEKGHPTGQSNLADCYRDGVGVKIDTAQALFWYEKAAELGDEDAKKKIECYKKNGKFREHDDIFDW
jgi:TPR repeat protein